MLVQKQEESLWFYPVDHNLSLKLATGEVTELTAWRYYVSVVKILSKSIFTEPTNLIVKL